MLLLRFFLCYFFLAAFLFSFSDLYGQTYAPGTDEYNDRLKEAQEAQVNFLLNDKYITNTMRDVMKRYPTGGWYYCDHFLGSGPDTTATFLADMPIIDKNDSDEYNISIFFAFMAYLLDMEQANINMLGGVNLYLPDKKTKIFGGAYFSIGYPRLTEEDIEDYATGDDIIMEGNFVNPYLYIDSPLTDFLRTRLDSNLDASAKELYRFGAGVFARLTKYDLIGLFDRNSVPDGHEYNVSLGGRAGEGSLVNNPNAEVLPHLTARLGSVYTKTGDTDGSLTDKDSIYLLAEVIPELTDEYQKTNYIFGACYTGAEGFGLRAGIYEWDDNLYWIFSVQYNYLLIDNFGARINKWSYVFKLSNAF